MIGPEDAEWHWAVCNPSSSDLLLWLEPWVDEVVVPSRSTAVLFVLPRDAGSDSLQIENANEHIVIWAGGGTCIEVYVDGERAQTASATIEVPEVFGQSPKDFLNILFEGQPSARLAGAGGGARRFTFREWVRRRLRF